MKQRQTNKKRRGGFSYLVICRKCAGTAQNCAIWNTSHVHLNVTVSSINETHSSPTVKQECLKKSKMYTWKKNLLLLWFITFLINSALKWTLDSSATSKLEAQCRYCLNPSDNGAPLLLRPLTFKADEPESGEKAGSLFCLHSIWLFDYWAKLFNQVWNHKKAAVLHCPGTEAPFFNRGPCVFFLSGCRWKGKLPSGSAQCGPECCSGERTRHFGAKPGHVLGQEEKGSGPRTGADFLPPRNIWNLCGFCGKYGRLVVEPRPFVYLKQLCRNGRVLETV